MQVKFALKLKAGVIQLVSDEPLSDEELISIEKELEPISDIITLLGNPDIVHINTTTREYIDDRKAFILCMGEYRDQEAVESDLTEQDYIIKNNYIYNHTDRDCDKIVRFNFIGRWIDLSPKLRNIPIPIIWTFPDTFSIWYGDYYTTVKQCREWTSMGLMEIDITNWKKDK